MAPVQAAGGAAMSRERLETWVAALDAVIDELHDDLVRRAVVHLTTLREDLVAAAGAAD